MDNAGQNASQRPAPLVSVIIPVRDNPDGICSVLDCLAMQTLPAEKFEVVIGDDGSRPDLAPTAGSVDYRVRVVRGQPRTSYAARNAAARIAQGEVLAFCDSDCLPEPKWLEQGLAALEQADVVAGEVKFLAPSRPTSWTLLTIDLFLDQRQNVKLSRAVTANLFIHRRRFKELRGFDESLPSGGDYEFVGRAVKRGARLRHGPEAAVGHPTMDRGRSFLQKIWRTNHTDGVRRGRNREKMDLLGALILIPVVGVVIARHRAFRPAYRLDRARLEAAVKKPTLRSHLLAVGALYTTVCLAAGTGLLFGWLDGVRLARSAARPVYASPAAADAPSRPSDRGPGW
jgi:GT2 family glycosyltransferase